MAYLTVQLNRAHAAGRRGLVNSSPTARFRFRHAYERRALIYGLLFRCSAIQRRRRGDVGLLSRGLGAAAA